MDTPSRLLSLSLIALCLFACGKGGGTPQLTREQLLDPAQCTTCHQDHYAEWAGSMHAYASDDPVFRAMNARGQRETDGGLGNFCVNCHAPMAVHEGATTDGLNLDTVPQQLHGVTCFFCHSVDSVDGAHNNPLTLSTDLSMRGAITDPYAPGRSHLASYSALLDREAVPAAATCGACHDIVSPHGAAIERTFAEWQVSAFATTSGTTCGQCHMPQTTVDTVAANVPGAPLRRPHSHAFPAIDKALTTFPNTDSQSTLLQAFLDTTLQTALCVEPFGGGSIVSVIVDNVAGGHGFPSGASQDRRVWAEVIAYSGDNVVYQSGVVPDGTAVTSTGATDPDLWLMRDCMFDSTGAQTDMFWPAATYQSDALPALTTFDISDPTFYQTHKQRFYPTSGAPILPPAAADGGTQAIDHITMRIRVRPVGLDVIDDLVASGDLDAGVRDAIQTYDVGSLLEWTQATATSTYVDRNTGLPVFCHTDTNLNVQADKFPATSNMSCKP